MNDLALPLKKINQQLGTLYVPVHIYQQYVQTATFPNCLIFGTKTVQCEVAPHRSKKNEYLLSTDLWEQLLIPYESVIYVLQKDSSLYIGPLIGIFTAGFTPSRSHPLGVHSQLFAKLLSVEKIVGTFYFVFGANEINWLDSTINGYFYTSHGWQQIVVPLPNVVYDRLPNRKVESLQSSKLVKERFQSLHFIRSFNPGFFNKWHIHELLINDKTANLHLPKSFFEPTYTEIQQLLEVYKEVYLKPANGSLGIGIQHLVQRDHDPFIYCRYHDKGNRLRRYSSLNHLLNRQFPKGMWGLIAQQGIDLLRWNNRPIDFRVHTNKDINGKWCVSALAIKIAGTGSVTTHLNNGGEVKSTKEFYHELGASPTIINKINETALLLSSKIDEKMPGLIGEIGFDFGVDQEEHVWMFEANSKPGRTIFAYPNMQLDDLNSRKLLVEYAIYLFKEAALT